MLVIGQAGAVTDRDVDEDRQDHDKKQCLTSEGLGQVSEGLPANGISRGAELMDRLHQLLQTRRREAGNCHSDRMDGRHPRGHNSCG